MKLHLAFSFLWLFLLVIGFASEKKAGLYFDWAPNKGNHFAHLDNQKMKKDQFC